MKNYNHDYGLSNSEPISIPKAIPAPPEIQDEGCPNCGCQQLMFVTVRAANSLLTNGIGTGSYIGCPACPYASPMALITDKETVSSLKEILN